MTQNNTGRKVQRKLYYRTSHRVVKRSRVLLASQLNSRVLFLLST
jgi:hypothetical protein